MSNPRHILVCGIRLSLIRDSPSFYSTVDPATDPKAVPRIEIAEAHGRWSGMFYGRELHITSRHKPTMDEAIGRLEARILAAMGDVCWLERDGT